MSIRFYRHPISGHCHRVELFLSQLGLQYESVDVDLLKSEHKAPEFLARNPLGQVPVIEEDGVAIYDSSAILVYLAHKYDREGRWLPRDPLGAARVQQWLAIAAGPLASGPAYARLIALFNLSEDPAPIRDKARALFSFVEAHLAPRRFLAAEHPTIADLAMYAYTARAPEGGVRLDEYPNVRGWLARIEALPRFVPMMQAAG